MYIHEKRIPCHYYEIYANSRHDNVQFLQIPFGFRFFKCDNGVYFRIEDLGMGKNEIK